MSVLLETSLGDITIDLDIVGSPLLSLNFLKLAKARYYTNTLIYNIQHGRFCQGGDPRGDGLGGCSIYGLIDSIIILQQNSNSSNTTSTTTKAGVPVVGVDVSQSKKRFIKSHGQRMLTKSELDQKGKVIAIEMNGIQDTIGSQFIITIDGGENKALDGYHNSNTTCTFYSLGTVVEDFDNVLDQLNTMYCDKEGRPYADIRLIRVHILDDPFDDPNGMDVVLQAKGVTLLPEHELLSSLSQQQQQVDENDDDDDGNNNNDNNNNAITTCCRWISSSSPDYERPPEEIVEIRISVQEALRKDEETEEERKLREEELRKKQDESNAVVLEMLGDIASADMKPPENVLFVCKLNPATDDEDLQLIFSRFDPKVQVEIIRDADTGDSLQYAFVEFTTVEQCNEAYFKMNNVLVDDRRIKVDFSQSVAKVWNRYAQRKRGIGGGRGGGGGGGGGSSSHLRSYRNERRNVDSNFERKYNDGMDKRNGPNNFSGRTSRNTQEEGYYGSNRGHERDQYNDRVSTHNNRHRNHDHKYESSSNKYEMINDDSDYRSNSGSSDHDSESSRSRSSSKRRKHKRRSKDKKKKKHHRRHHDHRKDDRHHHSKHRHDSDDNDNNNHDRTKRSHSKRERSDNYDVSREDRKRDRRDYDSRDSNKHDPKRRKEEKRQRQDDNDSRRR